MLYNPAAIRMAYDEIAHQEDQLEKGHSLRNEIPREFIARYLRSSDSVLDAGGGVGINAIAMARRCARVTLLDISAQVLALAAANIRAAGLADRVDLLQGDITVLQQFGDASYSFVVCLGGAISYALEKGPQAIRELVRVARSGAILIVGCDSRYGFVRWLLGRGHWEEAVQVYRAGQYEAGEGAYARLYIVAELTGLLQEAGCDILEVASTPILVDAWEQNAYPEDRWRELLALELSVCTVPELLGVGHHLFCVARKRELTG